MELKKLTERLFGIAKKLKKNKLVAAALILGVVLLLLPPKSGGTDSAALSSGQMEEPAFSLEEQEEKLAGVLAKIAGAGSVRVVLTLKTGAEREVVTNEETTDSGSKTSTVTAQSGSGRYETVTRRYIYPQYQGALVVCEGAGSAAVRLNITQAVSALTGLGSDRITVAKMEK